MEVLSFWDFKKNEIRNPRAQNLATDPASPVEGQFYHDSVNHVPKWHNGTTFLDLTNAAKLNSQNAAYYLNRANHSSTQPASTISDFDTAVRTSRLDQMAAPTADVSFNNRKLTGLADGTASSDGINLGQLQAAVAGLSWKQSVRTASIGGEIVTISSPGNTIGGVTMAVGNRALLRSQISSNENGIYIWNGAAVPMTRASDANTGAELQNATVFVEEGTLAGTAWNQTTDNIVIDTTAVVWVQFAGANTYGASMPISLTGNSFILNYTNKFVLNGSNQLDLPQSIATSASPQFTNLTLTGGITVGNGTNIAASGSGNFNLGLYPISSTGNHLGIFKDGNIGIIDRASDLRAYFDTTLLVSTSRTYAFPDLSGTFALISQVPVASDIAYDATSWNGNTDVPTKNAVRDKFETLTNFPKIYTATIGDGSATSFAITQATHGLRSDQAMIVQLYDVSTDAMVYTDISINHTNGTVTIAFASAPTTNAYRVVIHG